MPNFLLGSNENSIKKNHHNGTVRPKECDEDGVENLLFVFKGKEKLAEYGGKER